jgi:hypothetical protein
MAGGAFDKDFGYLMPFLDKVAAAASAMPDRAARDELTRLMADEKLRWNRIRSLLAGAAGEPAKRAEGAATTARPVQSATAEPVAETVVRESFSFTVGSLRSRER